MSAVPCKMRILIAYTDAGGGHKATALTLKAVIERETAHEVILMNPYKELIADVDLFARLTPYTDEDVYNKFVLGKGWNNLFCLTYYAATLLNVKLGTRESAKRFCASWKQQGVDLVISVMPMANQGLYQSVRACFPEGPLPFLVVMTDLAETMKTTWFPKAQDYFAVCPTRDSFDRLLAKPHPPDRVFCTDGLCVHPKFYDTRVQDVADERKALGLFPQRLTGCVMYGGNGSDRMVQIARAMATVDRKVQMIFLCGKNKKFAAAIRDLNLAYPHVIRTFTDKVPYFFAVSDFLVGKPGPGTISEALVSGLVPIVDAGQALPQEQYNLNWLKEQNLGSFFKRIPQLSAIIRNLSASGRPGPQVNRAVFKIPQIVEHIFSQCNSK